MEASQRDTTDDWRITPARTPTTVVQLEGRIDLALSTARAAEEAALEIGAASLEAAQQAHRAAALAERASIAAARAAADVAAARADPPRLTAAPPENVPAPVVPQAVVPPPPAAVEVQAPAPPAPAPIASAALGPTQTEAPRKRRADPFDERVNAFRERAEKVMIRLQKLEAGDPPGAPSEVVRLR